MFSVLQVGESEMLTSQFRQSPDFVNVLGSVAAVIEALPISEGVPSALVNDRYLAKAWFSGLTFTALPVAHRAYCRTTGAHLSAQRGRHSIPTALVSSTYHLLIGFPPGAATG
jgi:hypothetical protein